LALRARLVRGRGRARLVRGRGRARLRMLTRVRGRVDVRVGVS
jgi:hypothetical protein